jgi:hypothetical protein
MADSNKRVGTLPISYNAARELARAAFQNDAWEALSGADRALAIFNAMNAMVVAHAQTVGELLGSPLEGSLGSAKEMDRCPPTPNRRTPNPERAYLIDLPPVGKTTAGGYPGAVYGQHRTGGSWGRRVKDRLAAQLPLAHPT